MVVGGFFDSESAEDAASDAFDRLGADLKLVPDEWVWSALRRRGYDVAFALGQCGFWIAPSVKAEYLFNDGSSDGGAAGADAVDGVGEVGGIKDAISE